jgi:hypothetical protein
MLIFDVMTNDSSTVFLTDPRAGCWLRFQDEELVQELTPKVRAYLPLAYHWQLTAFRPLWTGQAHAEIYITDSNTRHVTVLLSDDRRITAGNCPGSSTSVEAWLRDSVGLRVPE